MTNKRSTPGEPEFVAGNGLIHRRALLGRGIALAGALGTGAGASLTSAAAEPMVDHAWTNEVGAVIPAYQVPSRFEDVLRTVDNPTICRVFALRTPHHLLRASSRPTGCISPSATAACRTSIPTRPGDPRL